MRHLYLVLFASGIAWSQIIIGGGSGGGGGGGTGTGGAANYKLAITSTNVTWTVTSAQHGNAHANLLVQCYTAATPAVPLIAVASAPAAGQFAWSVHPTTFTVTITFTTGGNNGGYCVINGSGQGTPGEVTSVSGTYADNAFVLFSGATGDVLKPSTDTGFPFLSAGIYSPVGFTGTGGVVLSTSPSISGAATIAGATVTNLTVPAAGTADLSAAAYLRTPSFTTGAPAAECDDVSEAGKIRRRNGDPAVANSSVRDCRQTGASTYSWQPIGYNIGTVVPGACAAGDLFIKTDATPLGQQLFICSAGNVWTLAGDGGGTGGSIAVTTSALKGNGGGGAVAVTGTASDCVKVDGSSGSCGTGTGGGGNPFSMSVNTTADTVTLTATRLVNFHRGKELTTVNSGETFTWDTPSPTPVGDGDFIIYYNGGMVLSSAAALTGIGTATTSSRPISASSNASTGLTLPQGAIPLFAGSVAAGNFVNTSTNQYAGDSVPYVMDVDASMTLTGINDYTLRFSVSGSSSGVTIQDEGAEQGTGQTTLNCAGAGITCAVAGSTTTLTVGPGGGTPGGTTTELQYRTGASTFGGITGSSVSGANVVFDGQVSAGPDQRVILTNDATGGYLRLNDATGNPTYSQAQSNTVDAASIAMGTAPTLPGLELWVKGGIRFIPRNTGTAPYTCVAARRGLLWYVQSAAAAGDILQICAKKADDTYAWLPIFTAP